jgi:hypothetical protein
MGLHRKLALAILALVVGWSIWFFLARWAPTHCTGDACPIVFGDRSSEGERVLRYVLWIASVGFAVRAVGKPERTPHKVLIAAGLSIACFAAVLVTLGEPFPPLPRMLPGE